VAVPTCLHPVQRACKYLLLRKGYGLDGPRARLRAFPTLPSWRRLKGILHGRALQKISEMVTIILLINILRQIVLFTLYQLELSATGRLFLTDANRAAKSECDFFNPAI